MDVALSGRAIAVPAVADRGAVLRRLRLGDEGFRHLTRGAAIFVLVLLSGIIVSLVYGSLPALRAFGVPFV